MNVNLLRSRCTILDIQTLKNIPKCCYASEVKSQFIQELEAEDVPKYEVEPKIDEEKINEIRNKSRLFPADRNLLYDQKPYNKSYEFYHDSVWYRKKMLGRYGIEAAGVTAAICWPTKEDIEDAKEYERIAYPKSIKETMQEIEQRKIDESLEKQKREEEIDKVIANFGKWKTALEAKIAKKEAELLEAKRKKEQIMEEIREQVGYNVDPRDERFQAILEQKEKEDKKRKKEEKKKQKTEKLLAYIQRTNLKLEEKENQEKSDDTIKNKDAVEEKSNDTVKNKDTVDETVNEKKE